VRGVTDVESGYCNGQVERPTYEQVCTGTTGHAEVVKLDYDPAQVSLRQLLEIFFTIHDPTTKDRQGNDVGPQYRSIILAHSDAQAATARAVMDEVARAGIWDGPLVTELVPEAPFWPAEPEHHDYFARNPWSGYCRVVVAPKVLKFRKIFADRLKPAA